MSALVDRAIHDAGLSGWLEARCARAIGQLEIERLCGADLLALGALADRVRSIEVGDGVRIYTDVSVGIDAGVVVLPHEGNDLTGLDLLRQIAIARIAGADRARVRVDWTRSGLELAQVALGFGANELFGRITSKRGLPIAEGQLAGVGKKTACLPAQRIKRRELAELVRRAGRVPAFVEADGSAELIDAISSMQETP